MNIITLKHNLQTVINSTNTALKCAQELFQLSHFICFHMQFAYESK